jgi:hypothetical protein
VNLLRHRSGAEDAASRVEVGVARCSIVESLVWPDAVDVVATVIS